ncbi:recombinase family protein [Solibacillus sp. R5-41]|uniref:recombinase family protein n=1 Tax=Solibacillus sp. R5-41 TaxID=2048654 RepID=UPI0020A3AECF|nr:recombinase family protein [Solibacillus sp. R5-41]
MKREGISIAKERWAFKGKRRKYHAEAKRKNPLVYKEAVRLLKEKESVMNIHCETVLTRNTIYMIKKELNDK